MKPLSSANELQGRFTEIGLPQPLMVELQVTDFELPWDEAAQANRQRFLEEGYILVVDHRSREPRTFLVSAKRQRVKLESGDPVESKISA